MSFFVVANDLEEKLWGVEYILRRDLGVSYNELADMPLVKTLYFIDRLKKEAEAIESMNKQ